MDSIRQNGFPEQIGAPVGFAEEPPSKSHIAATLTGFEELEALRAEGRLKYVKAFLKVLDVPCPENANCFVEEEVQAVVRKIRQREGGQEDLEAYVATDISYQELEELIAPFWQIAIKTGAQVSTAFPVAPDGIDEIPTPLKVWFLGYSMITDRLGNEVVLVTTPGLRDRFKKAQQKLIQEFLDWETKNRESNGTDKENAWQSLRSILSRIWELVNIVEEGYFEPVQKELRQKEK